MLYFIFNVRETETRTELYATKWDTQKRLMNRKIEVQGDTQISRVI